jgi:CubicO group peptidase (beta-lactamase class C family)
MYSVLSYLPTAILPGAPPFARYIAQNFFAPLGLNSTTYSFAAANATGRMADGFARVAVNASENPVGRGTPLVVPYFLPDVREDGDRELSFQQTPSRNIYCFSRAVMSGPGGVLSSATDVVRLCSALSKNNTKILMPRRRAGCRCSFSMGSTLTRM